MTLEMKLKEYYRDGYDNGYDSGYDQCVADLVLKNFKKGKTILEIAELFDISEEEAEHIIQESRVTHNA